MDVEPGDSAGPVQPQLQPLECLSRLLRLPPAAVELLQFLELSYALGESSEVGLVVLENVRVD